MSISRGQLSSTNASKRGGQSVRLDAEARSSDLPLPAAMAPLVEARAVGLVGVGLLGQALAHRLLGAGFAVSGFDIDPAKAAKLVELGGRPAAAIEEIAEHGDPIVLAVLTTDQVEDVLERQLLPMLGDGSGRLVLCASTCDPDRIAALAERVSARGVRFLETPISGSSGQVSRGEGVGLVGGDREVFAEAR